MLDLVARDVFAAKGSATPGSQMGTRASDWHAGATPALRRSPTCRPRPGKWGTLHGVASAPKPSQSAMSRQATSTEPDLFKGAMSVPAGAIDGNADCSGGIKPDQESVPAIALAPAADDRVREAERLLLELADFIYGHTSLKPMSKTLFVLSRCLLVAPQRRGKTVAAVVCAYQRQVAALGAAAPTDDFHLPDVLRECGEHLGHVLAVTDEVKALCSGSDSLGLAFNTLLRGKWESGEGLGTHLTPEEVVEPMVRMALGSIALPSDRAPTDGRPLLLGDPCGGTGRFAFSFAVQLRRRGHAPAQINAMLRLYDQSALSVDFARLNFAFDGLTPRFARVDDSLTCAALSEEVGRYLAVATNPPFGTGKYRWTPDLQDAIGPEVLAAIGMRQPGDVCDPALLFLFRCLDLLALEGVLAIILPDGIVHASWFKETLLCYERSRVCGLDVLGIVSLPTATFSLGGTVAKTSFLLVRKSKHVGNARLYVARAGHIGFKKRGNRRVSDPAGNDLAAILNDYLCGQERKGRWLKGWRTAERLMPTLLLSNDSAPSGGTKPLSHLARLRRERGVGVHRANGDWHHVSVLDVDGTGVIDIAATSTNEPATPPQACCAGDVLVSCLNPRIWRAAVVPDLPGVWTCSGEFAVLTPHDGVDPWKLAVTLHQKAVIERATALASGTSSSRQRVNKEALLSLPVSEVHIDPVVIQHHKDERERLYRVRLREHHAFAKLHAGEETFVL